MGGSNIKCMCWVWRGPPSPLAFQRLLGSRRYSVLCGCLIHGCGSTITNRQSHVLLCSTASLPPSPTTWLPGTLAYPLSSWIHSLIPSGPDELCCLPRVSLCQCLYIPARVHTYVSDFSHRRTCLVDHYLGTPYLVRY